MRWSTGRHLLRRVRAVGCDGVAVVDRVVAGGNIAIVGEVIAAITLSAAIVGHLAASMRR